MVAQTTGWSATYIADMDLVSFGSLCDSCDRISCKGRAERVMDMALSAQGDGKGIESFVGDLERGSGYRPSAEKGGDALTSKFGGSL